MSRSWNLGKTEEIVYVERDKTFNCSEWCWMKLFPINGIIYVFTRVLRVGSGELRPLVQRPMSNWILSTTLWVNLEAGPPSSDKTTAQPGL